MTTTITAPADLARILETYNDVTERLKHSHELLTREVARLREELHEKNRELARRERLAALGEMAAGVAHEIRNPLGGIGLYASLLEGDLRDRPREQSVARQILSAVRGTEAIVEDILAFARGAEPNRQTCRLAGVVDAALTQCAVRAVEGKVNVEVDLRLTGMELFCDPAQVERALVNLINNAIDAAGRSGRVWVRAGENKRDPHRAAIVVEDNGPGISPEHLQRVFDPFFTTKDNGTGLGLAIVHRIAEQNGGSISATHRPDGGARFILLLPRAKACNQS
ncbi:MAG: ATP-binding protein [Phycisphaerae bacterium]|nr:ATP-binding protein [Phycisphaerae bacterium]